MQIVIDAPSCDGNFDRFCNSLKFENKNWKIVWELLILNKYMFKGLLDRKVTFRHYEIFYKSKEKRLRNCLGVTEKMFKEMIT